ncbi:MAG: ornithine carbamoyltransferase [Candidatus Aerophobetes bacterium]|nr:ornithine carbamoyltransferase [Candidatus Aerophobetes bacterium]
MKKDLLSILDISRDDILNFFDKAEEIRDEERKNSVYHPLKGKSLGMIFQKPSTRTRLSFEVGMYQLGGHPVFLSSESMQLKRGETIEDTAKVLSRYLDGIMIRTFDQDEVVKLAKAASIPVINGLTDLFHPCQALSDYYTLWRGQNNLSRITLCYVGDGNNVCHSLILGAVKLGVNIIVSTPKGYEPNKEIVEKAKKINTEKISFINNPLKAVKEADVIYTDVWTSMGEEKEEKVRKEVFLPYQVNLNLLKKAKEKVLVMHCLPAHRGEEIVDEVMDGENSIVFEQAENRLHLQKAILVKLLS